MAHTTHLHARPAVLLAGLLAGLLPALAPAGEARDDEGSDPFFACWETIGEAQGLPSEKVLAVAVDGPRVWAGTGAGLALLEDGRVRTFGTEQGLPFPVVSALALDPRSGDLWIGTLGGLARLSAGRIDAFTQLDSGLANDVVYGLALDGDSVWVATAAGLSRYVPRSRRWEIYDVSNTLMHEPWCYGVTTADGDVYVAVWGGGIVVRDGKSGVFREHRDPDGEMEVDLYRDDGLVHDVTSSVAVAGSAMWVGTYFGLSRYDGRRWRSYCAADSGLAGDFINHVVARDEVVWIATDQGLSRFDSREWTTWQRAAPGEWELGVTAEDHGTRRWTLTQGPPSDTIYQVALQGGDLWLATAAGLGHGVSRKEQTAAPSGATPNQKGR